MYNMVLVIVAAERKEGRKEEVTEQEKYLCLVAIKRTHCLWWNGKNQSCFEVQQTWV